MATLKEILRLESPASGGIRLWPEGIFYKAYDCSAYLFVHELRPYRPKRKYYKVVGGDVFSIGFPMSALPSILRERHVEAVDSAMGTKYIALGKPVEEQAFRKWAEGIPPEEEVTRSVAAPLAAAPFVPVPDGDGEERKPTSVLRQEAETMITAAEQSVLVSLRGFSLESASPMQCMLFVAELRKRLQPDTATGGGDEAKQSSHFSRTVR